MQLQATLRTITGKQVNSYRKRNTIPGVLYGKHTTHSTCIFFDKNSFLKVYKECSKSIPVQIIGEGIDELVLIHDIDVHPVTAMLSHVDFLVLKKGESVYAEVELCFVWESPVDKNRTWRINVLLNSIEVFADPIKLPKNINVDMSMLKNIHDVLFIKDLVLPEGVRVENNLDQPVVTVVDLGDENEGSGTSENAAGFTALEDSIAK